MKKNTPLIEEKRPFINTNFIAVLSFVFVAFIITGILSSRYFSYQNIAENGISKRQIKAKKTIEVVDTLRTDTIKRDIASKIRPVVMPVDEQLIKTSLFALKENVEKVRNSKLSNEQKEGLLADIFDIPDNQKENIAIKYLLTAPEYSVTNIFQTANQVLDHHFKVGITENEIEYYSNDTSIIGVIGQRPNPLYLKTVSTIIDQVLFPNIMIDDYATDIARKNAKSMVRPYMVTFKKGSVIIEAGEALTQVKKDALKKAGYNPFELNKSGVFGIFLLTCLAIGCFLVYVKKFEKQYLSYRYMSIIASLVIVLVYLCMVISSSQFTNYLMPFGSLTLILAVFTNPVFALVVTFLMLALLSSTLFLSPGLIAAFIFGTVVAAYSVSNICYTKRFDLIKCGFYIGLALFVSALVASILDDQADFVTAFLAFLLNGMVAGGVALGVIPLIESVFKIVTPYGLIELADHNQTLLSNLQYKAPGTYHHSLMVANLCEAAAEAIGANPILARVGAFYHDIGKLKRPLFFIENQSYFGIENPHTKLNPRLSKMVITSHTKDGVELAKEYGLPQVIIDFIQRHHGEALAGHFYSQAVQLEGKENVQEEQFRYPGPKPNIKEIAILMLADAVESAVRSLKNPSAEEIENMINRIITERLNDGQLSESPLTLRDIKVIAITFNRILRGMQHDRIKYQNLNDLEDKNKIKLCQSKEEKLEKRIQKKQMQKSGECDNVQPPKPQEEDKDENEN